MSKKGKRKMTYETKRKIARSRAVNATFKQGIDPVINRELFNANVRALMEAWDAKHGGETE